MIEYFVAKRYLRSKHRLNFISIISIISTIGVTLGVAALIIVLSVFNGFGSLVTSMLINFDPHLRITSTEIKNNNFTEIKDFLEKSDLVESYSGYVEGKVILTNSKSMEILNIKGIAVDDEAGLKRLEDRVKSGEMDLNDEGNVGKIIISLPIAIRLSTKVTDTIYTTSAVQIKNSITRMSMPKTKAMIVSGIYEISNKEYALEYCFTSISSAQTLLNMNNQISGIEVNLYDLNNSEDFKAELLQKFPNDNLIINTWYDLHKDLYRVMLIERWAAYILLSLIIAVAAFNILSSLTMSVLEKKKDIGILRAIGTTKGSIKKIFMFEGILIGIIGTVLGIIIGLFICYLQINFNIYPLDASKYVIDTLPVQVKFSDIFAVALMSFILTFFASKYPANRALKTKVLDAIKWE
ncbi:MAG: ABC transporter permease [Ignavibacteriae bacterium]|nr:ABC transporter permease [Ignavibacteriota bacterium]MCB9206656.1 ABC transporter permease [Ignavibacteriales bacterium]MCB9210638.1 ABC transporter permease [Ignavibacteriales bacterium]MCB9218760.1 ABC transporter permease [Ignavibacteriales bacterium]MCB9259236.1 ABC transporter permease [Ignavibacteriales bacterium]